MVRISTVNFSDCQNSEVFCTLLKCVCVCVCVCVCAFQDISSVYQIFTDEVLGSGQFGVVYKGELGLTTLINHHHHYYHSIPVLYEVRCSVFVLLIHLV